MRFYPWGLVSLSIVSPFGCSSANVASNHVPQDDAGPDAPAAFDAGPPAALDAAPPDACAAPTPPPSGFALLDPGMDQGNGTADRGMHTALAVDSDGSPLIAYERIVTSDGGSATSEVWFTRWDRSCGGRWIAPMKVDSSDHLTDSARGIDVAYDSSNGSVGIAYRAQTNIPSPPDVVYEIRVATLSKGATAFTIETAFGTHSSDPNAPAGPRSASIVMNNGSIWVAGTAGIVNQGCSSNCDGVLWAKRSGATWGSMAKIVAPYVTDYGVSLAIDSNGTPAIAYAHGSMDGSMGALSYRRLDGNAIDAITGISADEAELAFDGTKPRLAGKVHQADWATTNKEIWFSASNDGMTWNAAINIPNDQGDTFDEYPTLAIGPSGRVMVAAAIAASNGSRSFGTPKYSTSTDLATFSTTGPALVPNAGIDYTEWMRAGYGEGGRVQIAFYLSVPASPYVKGQGLVYWRE